MSKARPIGRAFSHFNRQRIKMSKSVKGSIAAGMIGLAFVFATPFVRKHAERLAARDVPLWKKDNGDPIIDISAAVESMKTTWASAMRAANEKNKPEDSVIEEDPSSDESVEKIYLVIPDEDDKITGTDNK